jgi:type IV secretory pathway VirB6-like protein
MNLIFEFLNILIRIGVIIYGIIDLSLTWNYISRYKKLCPNKSFNKMERNPLIRVFLNYLGIKVGMIVSIIFIMSLISIIAIDAHIIIVIILISIQIFALINHNKNFKILKKLERKNK